MASNRKSEQIQIRVTPNEKAEIRRGAQEADMDVSTWILGKVLSDRRATFEALMKRLPDLGKSSAAYAELSDFLHEVPRSEFSAATDVPPPSAMSDRVRNYVAAMVEHAAMKKGARPPAWTKSVEPLADPYFGTTLKRVRLLLMMSAPVAFRRRNIFVDSSVGDRV